MSFEEPSWARLFLSRYHYRVRFGSEGKDGKMRTSDGRSPVAYVQVISWSAESARQKAIATARSLYRDDNVVQREPARAEGYRLYSIGWKRRGA